MGKISLPILGVFAAFLLGACSGQVGVAPYDKGDEKQTVSRIIKQDTAPSGYLQKFSIAEYNYNAKQFIAKVREEIAKEREHRQNLELIAKQKQRQEQQAQEEAEELAQETSIDENLVEELDENLVEQDTPLEPEPQAEISSEDNDVEQLTDEGVDEGVADNQDLAEQIDNQNDEEGESEDNLGIDILIGFHRLRKSNILS